MFRSLTVHLLLMAGFALITYGLLEWGRVGFTLVAVRSFDIVHPHPVHLLLLGIAMVPPAFRELYLIDAERHRH